VCALLVGLLVARKQAILWRVFISPLAQRLCFLISFALLAVYFICVLMRQIDVRKQNQDELEGWMKRMLTL
jgi:hypothetical protein